MRSVGSKIRQEHELQSFLYQQCVSTSITKLLWIVCEVESMMKARLGELWWQPDFLKLWIGQTISLFGSTFGVLALSLTAVAFLKATPTQMGLLVAIGEVPWVVFGLAAGVWLDRIRRRPVLIGADLARALLLGSIPMAAILGKLQMNQLYAVAFLMGVATVLFDVAYQAYLPALISRDHLIEGNSKLNLSFTVANIMGPGLAGTAIQLLTAPIAVSVDAISFLISALSLSAITAVEPSPTPATIRETAWHQCCEGLRVIQKSPYIRAFMATNATFFFFNGFIDSIFLLYLTRSLHLPATAVGLVFGIGGIGGLIGSLVAARVATRYGVGPATVGAAVLRGASTIGIPLAGSLGPTALLLLILGRFVWSGSFSVYFVNQTSTRQAIVPDHLLGRVSASFWVASRGAVPIGALLGGFLGGHLGLQPALLIGAIGSLCSGLWLVWSPVITLRQQPTFGESEPSF